MKGVHFGCCALLLSIFSFHFASKWIAKVYMYINQTADYGFKCARMKSLQNRNEQIRSLFRFHFIVYFIMNRNRNKWVCVCNDAAEHAALIGFIYLFSTKRNQIVDDEFVQNEEEKKSHISFPFRLHVAIGAMDVGHAAKLNNNMKIHLHSILESCSFCAITNQLK